MKRFIKLLPVLFIAFFAVSCANKTENAVKLPRKGTITGGYKVIENKKYSDADIVLFEHIKTGANVIFVANDDTNRAFSLGYRTYPKDNKGLPHIFEHATITGSQKYPDPNLFFSLNEQTYTTYANALTSQLYTNYVNSSLSEKQLLTNFEYYLNGLYEPLIMTDKRLMDREAYRYVLENINDELSATGAVYNEMKGLTASINQKSWENTISAMFPNSVISFESGGKPEDILTVTWEELKDFHNKYYHPSNMLCCIYGKLDYEKFLEMLENVYLNHFEKEEIILEDDTILDWHGYKEEEFEYADHADSETEGKSVVSFSFSLEKLNLYEQTTFINLVCEEIFKESSWIKTTLREEFPNAVLQYSSNIAFLNPSFSFFYSNVNPQDKTRLKEISLQALNQIAENGIEESILDSFTLTSKMEEYLKDEDRDGIENINSICSYWADNGDPLTFMEVLKANDELCTHKKDKLIQKITKKVLDADKQALIVTKPVPGLAEQEAEKTEQFFKQKKASMSQSEKQALVDFSKEYNEWVAKNNEYNMIDQLKVVSISELPEEIQDAEVTESWLDSDNKIKTITSEIKNAKYTDVNIYFDSKVIEQDLLKSYVLFAKLIGNLPTKNWTQEELETKFNNTIYSNSSNAFYTIKKEGGAATYYKVSFMTLQEKTKPAFEIIKEILLNTDFSDCSKIRNIAQRIAFSKRNSYKSDPISAVKMCALPAVDSDYLYGYYTFDFDLWNYLDEVSKMSDEQIKELTQKFELIRAKLLNNNNSIITCISSKKGIKKTLDCYKQLSKSFCSENQEQFEYKFEPLPKSIAIVVKTDSNYNMQTNSIKALGMTKEDFTGDLLCIPTIIQDKYLFPVLRFKLGSYGAFSTFSQSYAANYSYRDPNIQKTFDVFKAMPVELKKTELTQDDLDSYIISAYQNFTYPVSKRSTINYKINKILNNDRDFASRLRYMKELKALTPEIFFDRLKLYEKLNNDYYTITAGNAKTIEAVKDNYDLIIYDLAN